MKMLLITLPVVTAGDALGRRRCGTAADQFRPGDPG